MKLKKFFIAALAGIMMLSTVAFADSGKDKKPLGYDIMKGKIEKIHKVENEDFLEVEFENVIGTKDRYILMLSEKSLIFNDKDGKIFDFKKLEEGMETTVFFREDTPMLMSYPGKFTPGVVIVNSNGGFNVDADRYNEDLEGIKHRLQINSYDKENVFKIENKKLVKTEDSLKNRELLVFYKESTRSIPPQTNAKLVYVLDKIEAKKEYKHDKEVFGTEIGFNIDPIEVDGNKLYPLREIFENAAAKVSWKAETFTAVIEMEGKKILVDTKAKTFKVNDEKEIELKDLKVVEVTLPQRIPICLWSIEMKDYIDLVSYSNDTIEIEDKNKLEGPSPNLQTFRFKVYKENDVTVSFKWSNINEIEKSFNDKEAYYLLKLKISK